MKIKGKFCNLITLEPKDYKILFNLRYRLNRINLINQIPKKPLYQKYFIKNEINKKNFYFGIYLKNKLVGTISIYNISKDGVGEMGRLVCIDQNLILMEAYYLLINFAFSKLKLRKIIGKTSQRNIKSKKLMRYFNFKYFCLNKLEAFWSNQYQNISVYILNRNIFLKNKKKFKSY